MTQAATKDAVEYTVLPEWKWKSQNSTVVGNPRGVFFPEVGDEGPKRAEEVLTLARDYWQVIADHEEPSVHAALLAAEAGDKLLSAAGHYRRAVVALRTMWHDAHGTHLDGVFDPELDDRVSEPLLRYVRHQTAYGASCLLYTSPSPRDS